MAQPQQNISVAAPGFMGVNTEAGPLELGLEWARIADQCVIDDFGRMASRKGIANAVLDNTALGGQPVEAMESFVFPNGSSQFYCAGNNKLFAGTTTLTEMTPTNAITDDNWQIVPFKGYCYFIQEAHEPMRTTSDAPTTLVSANTNTVTNRPTGDHPSCATAGMGRMWIGGYSSDRSFLAWSALVTDASWGTNTEWSAGDSGQLDISASWPAGFDTIESIKIHNGFLYVFGKDSIVIYSGADDDPTNNLQLHDTITGIGSVSRDSVVPIGRDLLFLDSNGVRSMSRVIQEKSAPIGDVSANIHSDMESVIAAETSLNRVRATYSPEEYLYLLIFPEENKTFAFDTRKRLEDGSYRLTTWHSNGLYSATRTDAGDLYLGNASTLNLYTGALDVAYGGANVAINWTYETHPQDFGDAVTSKFPKQTDVLLVGGDGQSLELAWDFDYANPTGRNKITNSFPESSRAEYGIAEYGIAEYSAVQESITDTKYNVWGSGKNITYRFSMEITKSKLAIQQIDMQALTGRIL